MVLCHSMNAGCVAPSPLPDASTWIVTGYFVLKYLSVVSSHTNDLSLSNAT